MTKRAFRKMRDAVARRVDSDKEKRVRRERYFVALVASLKEKARKRST